MASLFPQTYELLQSSPTGLSKSNVLGFLLLMLDPQAREPSVWSRLILGRTSDIVHFPVMCCPPVRYRIYVMKVPLLPLPLLWLCLSM